MNPYTLIALATEREFLWGLGYGVACVALVLAAGGRLPWLSAWSGGAAAGLFTTDWLQPFVSTPGWALVTALAFVVVGTAGAKVVDGQTQGPVLASLFALTVLGVWGTVPDTEGARVLMGVTAGMAPALLSRVTASGASVALALTAAVVLVDGVGRLGSIVGALGCAGMLLIVPVVTGFGGRREALRSLGGGTPLSAGLLVGAQVALVIASGRLAGTEQEPGRAAVIWAAAAAAIGGGWWGAETLRRRRRG